MVSERQGQNQRPIPDGNSVLMLVGARL